MRVIFVTTEVAPWSKVGGLADVMGALPPALAARGHQVMTVSPRYRAAEDVLPTDLSVPLDLPAPEARGPDEGDEEADEALETTARLFLARQDGVDHVFVDHPLFLAGGDIYSCGPSLGVTTYMEAGQGAAAASLDLRYSVLCQAALAAPLLLWAAGVREAAAAAAVGAAMGAALDAAAAAAPAFAAGPRTVFVANDWPATLCLLRLRHVVHGGATDGPGGGRAGAPAEALAAALRAALPAALGALCIHNLAYQGLLPGSAFDRLRLPESARASLEAREERGRGAGGAAPDGDGAGGEGAAPSPEVPRRGPDPGGHGQAPAGRGEGPQGDAEVTAAADRVVALAARPPAASGAPGPGQGRAEAPCGAGAGPEPRGPHLNLMRGGLLAADALLTVSPGYAREVALNAHWGCGLHDILAARGVAGILNGLDTRVWDPARDALLPPGCRYAAAGVRAGKAAAKAALQARLGLRADPRAPLFCFVGRLTQQKGVDVLLAALPAVMAAAPPPRPRGAAGGAGVAPGEAGATPGAGAAATPGIQVVVLGSGEAWMEAALEGLELSFPGQAAGLPLFSEELAHWLMAGSDFVLIPSRFEPCGLVAPCAMRYGTVPLVAATGGLQDMVDAKVGYTVPRLGSETSAVDVRQDVLHLIQAMRRAAATCGTPAHEALQAEGMARDVSWAVPAAEWEAWLASL
ncbi:GBSS1B [Auxenochlorella protothecoides x Auxenochlorella symbiontica]